MPKVSIIVPIYNVEKYLDRCVKSLLNQTLEDIEIILVDDGSPDNCPQMCDEYASKDSRVKVIHKKNAGLGYARNSGLEIATGEFVAFVDSDDYVVNNAYEILYTYAKKYSVDVVLSGYKRIEKNRECICRDINTVNLYKGNECISVLKGMIGIAPNVRHYDFAVWHGIYSTRLIHDNKIRFCSERDYISEDLVFNLSFIPKCSNICVIPDALYCYCLNPNTLTTKYKPGRLEANITLYNYIEEQIFDSKNDFLKENIQFCLDYLLIDKTISNLSYEIRYNEKCLPKITEIVDNELIRKAIKRYPKYLLNKKQRFIVNLIQGKNILLLYFLFKIKSKI